VPEYWICPPPMLLSMSHIMKQRKQSLEGKRGQLSAMTELTTKSLTGWDSVNNGTQIPCRKQWTSCGVKFYRKVSPFGQICNVQKLSAQ
jgi:hypothetical protein